MKKIDNDMVIILVFSIFFGVFLVLNKPFNISYKYRVIPNEMKVDIYRKDKKITLPINKYLIGVVGCEVDASYENEALKTQAIVARTYALRSLEINRQLTDDTKTQCYKDDKELKKKWGKDYAKYYEKVKRAVLETADLEIYYDDKLIDALYFATSNGYTEDAINVWGSNISYLVSVDSSWDKDDRNYKNTLSLDLDTYLNTLGVNNTNYKIISRDKSNRVVEIMVGDKTFKGVDFRKLLGLKSTDFEIDVSDNKVNITTYGYGHGVGLSQTGANYLAKKGYNYDYIIKHYYKGVIIK